MSLSTSEERESQDFLQECPRKHSFIHWILPAGNPNPLVFVLSTLGGKFHANVTFYCREESPALKLEHKPGTNIPPDTASSALHPSPRAPLSQRALLCVHEPQNAANHSSWLQIKPVIRAWKYPFKNRDWKINPAESGIFIPAFQARGTPGKERL